MFLSSPFRLCQLVNTQRFTFFRRVPRIFGIQRLSRRLAVGVGAYSRLGAYSVFLPLGWALIRGELEFEVGRLFE